MKSIIMNKLLFIVVAFLAVAALVHCEDNDSNESSSENFLEHVKSKHLKKFIVTRKESVDSGLSKIEEQCPGVTKKLKDALKSFGQCGERVDDSLTICASIQKYTLNCTQPILQVIDDCLPEKARGVPVLAVKSVVSLADYLCKLDGESIFELFNPCLYEDNGSSEGMTECEKKVVSKFDEYQNDVPSAQDICTLGTDLRPCVLEQAGASCKNPKTKNVAIGFYDALAHPCGDIINKN